MKMSWLIFIFSLRVFWLDRQTCHLRCLYFILLYYYYSFYCAFQISFSSSRTSRKNVFFENNVSSISSSIFINQTSWRKTLNITWVISSTQLQNQFLFSCHKRKFAFSIWKSREQIFEITFFGFMNLFYWDQLLWFLLGGDIGVIFFHCSFKSIPTGHWKINGEKITKNFQ